MAHKTRTGFLITTVLLIVALAACGFSNPQKFQMSFLPTTPSPAAVAAASQPPVVETNVYLERTPKFLVDGPKLPPHPTASDLRARKAEEIYQRAKRRYQEGDKEHARTEFDRAVDLMVSASEDPTDRGVFERRFDEMVDSIHRYDLAGLGPAVNIEEPRFEKSPLEDILEMTFPVDPKLKNKVKDEVQATVSQLPLAVNDSVLGFIHYFSGRGHKTMVAGLERAGRYRPLIQRILDEEGVPQELIHLAQAESGFLPRAVSRKRATGMWQFLSWRGQEYGLMQTAYSDDRLDPEKATRAAARHLRDLYTKFGDWYLAIAAYNCGPGTVEKAIERTGYADFWELRNLHVLPLETTNYVPIILAMTIMVKNAQEYDLERAIPESPLEYDTIEITSRTHLALIGDLTESPVSQLQALNPALLKSVAPAGYCLRVPKGSASTLMAALQAMPAERRASWRMHKVETGETLAMIGKRYGALPSSIAAANRMNSAAPITGDLLMIPKAAMPERRIVRTSGAPSRNASRHGSTIHRSSSKTASDKRPAQRPTPRVLTHTASNAVGGS